MLFDGALHALSMIFEVFLLDLILSGDNALVIAMACRGLPPDQLKRAVMIGTSGAIILRVLLTTLAGWLLLVPGLKLIGAVLLLVIAIRLLIEDEANEEGELPAGALSTLGGAVLTVLTADLIMSMDNVVGLAAVAQGSVFYLLLGLLLSVPLLMFGSVQIAGLLQRQPMLVSVGAALLGYVAGDIAVGDPVVVGWINSQSPALNQVVPLLCAVFVVLQARIIRRQRARLPRPQISRLWVPSVDVANVQMPSPPSAAVMAPQRVLITPLAPTVEVSAEASRDPAPLVGSRFGAYSGWVAVVAGLAGIFLVAGVLYSVVGALAGTLLPSAQKEFAYVCTGASTTVYYRPGGSTIRIVTGGGEASGYVNYKEILWQDAEAAARQLHLTPPSEIEKTSATVVTLNGGSFAQIACTRTL
ncbi:MULTISPECIES: TerC family protein [unclassified Pseudomonas]|uniref:TerC family protein n=1 Tax=unclassified Pseudomonas TaxID=196821 RepID=UPI002AC9C9EB|nr:MULTISPECIES: TerC family protein [unclassified Pseudomonas]MEB0046463.1 TerC family protein [Pseudomonas sp. Dout3]MEB0097889.1 TerC family protein [Pseudomonas sp. DC1.2]WPX59517.1 TerC family protein [Pseudomonas sp. DC1.2]